MNFLLNLHNKPINSLSNSLEPWLLPTLARFTFAATLLMYFWVSANLKISFPEFEGLTGFIAAALSPESYKLTFGAYGQIFPAAFEAVGYDPAGLSLFQKIIAHAGTYAEFILPGLLLIGLFTRLAALGMIGFTLVQSYVDIYGHMADETAIGTWFDRIADSQIMDQRLFWICLFALIFLRGAGPLSADRLIGLK